MNKVTVADTVLRDVIRSPPCAHLRSLPLHDHATVEGGRPRGTLLGGESAWEEESHQDGRRGGRHLRHLLVPYTGTFISLYNSKFKYNRVQCVTNQSPFIKTNYDSCNLSHQNNVFNNQK